MSPFRIFSESNTIHLTSIHQSGGDALPNLPGQPLEVLRKHPYGYRKQEGQVGDDQPRQEPYNWIPNHTRFRSRRTDYFISKTIHPIPVELTLQGLHLLSQPHDLLLYPGTQLPSLSKLLSRMSRFWPAGQDF